MDKWKEKEKNGMGKEIKTEEVLEYLYLSDWFFFLNINISY